MTEFIEQWWHLFVFTQDSIYNVVLIFVYAGLFWQLYRWFKQLLSKKEREVTLGKAFLSLLSLLLVWFFLSSLILVLVQPKFLLNWWFTGWLYTDIVLGVVYFVLLVSIVLFLLRYRKKRSKLWSMLGSLALMLSAEFLIGSVVLLLFCNGFSEVVFSSEKSFLSINDQQPLLINKERKRIPNGTKNGISTSITDFLLSGIDAESGKEMWHRHSSWQEYIIGDTPNGLFVVNTKKEAVYFLDRKTGKQVLSEAQWLKEIPELSGKLSYTFTDYSIVKEALYFYGLDGKYYKVDFKAKQLTSKKDYQEMVINHNLFMAGHKRMENYELQQQIETLYPDLLEVTLNTQLNNQTALVVYKAKRNAKNVELALVSTEKYHVFWQISVELSEDTDVAELQAFAEKGNIYVLPGKYVYKINEQTGEILYKFNYQSNHIE